ncbi:hypothetical protein Acid345_0468 [Candidatus Koribacter versatilis Ellin345]|uniref:Uncharacterized protein n=2 Tax=Candidatus Korobacter versatilis TaxID=658062 RepID=Q1IUH7_KORVE|nr:hypothetical protein Acid345_0468 [Candidatus Koribacter versatilis Ellin345]
MAASRLQPRKKISAHRLLVTVAICASIALVLAIVMYGFDYYWLSMSERPFSPKHFLLKPSGKIGIGFGLFGFGLFLIIFLYPLRKRIKWLAVRGSARHWLDFHVIAGCLAPVIIMFHASFKFQGIAGMAFWFMSAVALSGIAGRYVYAQIPPTLISAENSLKETERIYADPLLETAFFEMAALQNMPRADEIRRMSPITALRSMLWLDLRRPFLVARLRAHSQGRNGMVGTLVGFLPSSDAQLEVAIVAARKRAGLAKRVAFLAKTQQAFHLWHVIHRPFSYSFAVLAIIHLIVVFALGYVAL